MLLCIYDLCNSTCLALYVLHALLTVAHVFDLDSNSRIDNAGRGSSLRQ